MPEEYIYTGEVSGYVYLQGHVDHSGASVDIWNNTTSYNILTATDGSFKVASLIDGTYQFTAEKTGYAGVTINNIEILNSSKYNNVSQVLIISTPPPTPNVN
jgi:hypothetical protein